MNTKNGYTRSQLAKLTNCPYFIIDYLRNTNQLKFIKRPSGKGSTAIYHPDSVRIIEEHLNLHSEVSSNETS
ncbi:MAG: hypothetical protein H8D23_34490 [Candidatus Brocadiales bacterium]|nr:hypothetical protein [Candidatus Brocadiales bacterium]